MILPRDHIFAGLPARSARAILADPAWHFRCHTDDVGSRDPRNHYRTMSMADICALPVKDIAARDCHLFLWVTGPMFEFSFEVMQEWGFRYSAIAFTWVKLKKGRILASIDDLHVGLGYTTRKNTELVLLARRGSPKRRSTKVRELIVSPRREHSRKPDEIHDRIEQYCAGPYVELFARSSRKGWKTWGADEAPIASHLLYTQRGVLNDDVPDERQLGIDAGHAWISSADAMVVYMPKLGVVTPGMNIGIQKARSIGIPIEFRRLEAQG